MGAQRAWGRRPSATHAEREGPEEEGGHSVGQGARASYERGEGGGLRSRADARTVRPNSLATGCVLRLIPSSHESEEAKATGRIPWPRSETTAPTATSSSSPPCPHPSPSARPLPPPLARRSSAPVRVRCSVRAPAPARRPLASRIRGRWFQVRPRSNPLPSYCSSSSCLIDVVLDCSPVDA